MSVSKTSLLRSMSSLQRKFYRTGPLLLILCSPQFQHLNMILPFAGIEKNFCDNKIKRSIHTGQVCGVFVGEIDTSCSFSSAPSLVKYYNILFLVMLSKPRHIQLIDICCSQRTLTEREGSVLLTTSLNYLFVKRKIIFSI